MRSISTKYSENISASKSRNNAGFTLIELLIVVLIIGVLAAIAIPKFQNSKGKAYASTLKSDLRNLATAQEAYYYENSEYSDTPSNLRHTSSPGVTIVISQATAAGWSASATHQAANPLTCAIFIGSVPALSPATTEGVVGCTNP